MRGLLSGKLQENGFRSRDVAFAEHRLCDEKVVLGVLQGTGEAFNEALDLALGKRADKSIHRASALESDDGRNGFDAELIGDFRMLPQYSF